MKRFTLQGALMTARYLRRALDEAKPGESVLELIRNQLHLAEATVSVLRLLPFHCYCVSPISEDMCSICMLRARVFFVAGDPERYSSNEQASVVRAAADAVRDRTPEAAS